METGLKGRENFSFSYILSPNIPDLAKAKQDSPLHDSRIGTFEPSLYGMIIYVALTLLGRDQVNLLVYGSDRPYLKQKQKNVITKLNLSFSAF